MESLINSQQLDYENAESDTESDNDINTKPLHISIDDILDAEDSENPSKSSDEARLRLKNCWYQIFLVIECCFQYLSRIRLFNDGLSR